MIYLKSRVRWRLDSVPKFQSNYLLRHHLVPKEVGIYQRVNRRDTGFVSRKGILKVRYLESRLSPQAIPAVSMTDETKFRVNDIKTLLIVRYYSNCWIFVHLLRLVFKW